MYRTFFRFNLAFIGIGVEFAGGIGRWIRGRCGNGFFFLRSVGVRLHRFF